MNLLSILRALGPGEADSVVPGAGVIVEPGDRLLCDVPFAEVSSIFRMDNDLQIRVGDVPATHFKQFFTAEKSAIAAVIQFKDQELLASDLNKLLNVTVSLTDPSGTQHPIHLLPGSTLDSHPGEVFELNAKEFEVDNLHRYGDDLRIQSLDEAEKIIVILKGFFIKPSEGGEPPQLQLNDPEKMAAKDIMIHPNSSVFQWHGEPLPRAVVGSIYGYYFQLEGKEADNYVLVAKTTEGVLPAWLTFAHLGAGRYFLSGLPTPAAVGTHEISIYAHSTAAGVGLHTQQFFRLSVLSEDSVVTRSAVSDVPAAEFRKVGSLSDLNNQMSTILAIENMPYMTMPEIAAMTMLAAVNPASFAQAFSGSFTPYTGKLEGSSVLFEYQAESESLKGVQYIPTELNNLLDKASEDATNQFMQFIQVEQIEQPPASTPPGGFSETTGSESSPTSTSTSVDTVSPTASPVGVVDIHPEPSSPNNIPTYYPIIVTPPSSPPTPPPYNGIIDLSTSFNGFTLFGQAAGEFLGKDAAIISDVNGDGLDDLLVGVYLGDAGYGYGAAYLIGGSRSAFPTSFNISNPTVASTIFKPPVGETLGTRQVAGVGDFNGDGIEDFIIVPYFNPTAYLVFGSASGFPATVDLGTLASSGHAIAISSSSPSGLGDGTYLGDINGDGLGDIILANATTRNAYVIFGTTTPPTSLDVSSLNGSNGFWIHAPIGDTSFMGMTGVDLTGDGFNDIVINIYGSTPYQNQVAVIFGKSSTFPALVDPTALAPGDGFILYNSAPLFGGYSGFGVRMSANIGNFTQSGFDDLVIVEKSSKSAYVIFGDPSLVSTSTLDVATLDGTNGFRLVAPSYIGSVSYAGDVNGDGIPDMIVASYFAYGGKGAAYVIFGSENPFPAVLDLSTLTISQGIKILGTDPFAATYFSRGAGDINGDGLSDMVVGSWFVNNDTGAAYVIFGDNFTGAITQVGDPSVYIIQGTGSNEVIYSGAADHMINVGSGNTFINTGVGHNIVNGGSGTNTVVYSPLDIQVYGGSGLANTLWLANDGAHVNLVGTTVFSGFGFINLRPLQNMTGNSVALDAATVNTLSNNNIMTVNGDAHSILYLVATDYWINSASLAGYTTYTSLNGSVVNVQNAVHVLFQPTSNLSLSINYDLNTLMDGVRGFELTSGSGYSATSSTIVQNGDGFGALLIANGFDAGSSPFTRAFIVDGQATFHPSVPFTDSSVTLTTFNSDSLMSPIGAYGQHVSSIHDFNGDGINDVLISEFYGGPSFLMLGSFTSPVLFSATGISLVGSNTNTAGALGNVNGDYAPSDQSLADIILSDATTGWGAVIFGTTSPGVSINMTLLNGINGFQIVRPDSVLAPGLQDVAGVDLAGDGYNDIFVSYYNTTTQEGGIGVIAGQTVPFSATVSVSSAGIAPVGPGTATGFLITNSAGVPGPSDILINPTNIGNFTSNGIDSLALSSTSAVYVIFGDPAFATSSGFDVASLNGTNGFSLTSSYAAHITSIAYLSDVNGDGFSDFAFLDSQAYTGLGAVYVIFGSSTPFSANIDYTQLTSNQGFVITDPTGFQDNNTIVGSVFAEPTVSGGGDLNGDGLGDIIITSGSSQYVVFGANFTGAITQLGTDATVIQGKGFNDVIYAGSGDQTINGGTGTTFINGGAGNDIINGGSGPTTIVYDAFDTTSVDAGSSTAGQNTLWFQNDGILANLQNTLIFSDFDVINLRPLQSLTGNVVELNPLGVANMNTNNTLIVDGGPHDVLQLNNVGGDVWSSGAIVSMHGNSYMTYTSALTNSTVYAETTLHQVSIV